ncbi:MAG: hypothetical protein LBI02_09935 [Opitutaceae bacterium]|nr:hypothetical protein [Opitutaceae bacterium]
MSSALHAIGRPIPPSATPAKSRLMGVRPNFQTRRSITRTKPSRHRGRHPKINRPASNAGSAKPLKNRWKRRRTDLVVPRCEHALSRVRVTVRRTSTAPHQQRNAIQPRLVPCKPASKRARDLMD